MEPRRVVALCNTVRHCAAGSCNLTSAPSHSINWGQHLHCAPAVMRSTINEWKVAGEPLDSLNGCRWPHTKLYTGQGKA